MNKLEKIIREIQEIEKRIEKGDATESDQKFLLEARQVMESIDVKDFTKKYYVLNEREKIRNSFFYFCKEILGYDKLDGVIHRRWCDDL